MLVYLILTDNAVPINAIDDTGFQLIQKLKRLFRYPFDFVVGGALIGCKCPK